MIHSGKDYLKLPATVKSGCAPELSASRRLKYNLSQNAYDALWEAQEGKCAICLEHLTFDHIDHDHRTGETRGLLCRLCNVGLGSFKDNPDFLRAAINYLAHHVSLSKSRVYEEKATVG